jgi:streptogramin lyase
VFVSDTENHAIRRITPGGLVSTFGNQGISWPRSLSFGPNGKLYVADTGNHLVRVITPEGDVTTCATGYGVGCNAQLPAGGQRSSLSFLRHLRVDSAGNVLVSVSGVQLMRVDPVTAAVTVLAGPPASSGPIDGIGSNARFGSLGGLGVDASGNTYGTDGWGMSSPVAAKSSVYMIRRITPAGVVTTLTLTH